MAHDCSHLSEFLANLFNLPREDDKHLETNNDDAETKIVLGETMEDIEIEMERIMQEMSASKVVEDQTERVQKSVIVEVEMSQVPPPVIMTNSSYSTMGGRSGRGGQATKMMIQCQVYKNKQLSATENSGRKENYSDSGVEDCFDNNKIKTRNCFVKISRLDLSQLELPDEENGCAEGSCDYVVERDQLENILMTVQVSETGVETVKSTEDNVSVNVEDREEGFDGKVVEPSEECVQTYRVSDEGDEAFEIKDTISVLDSDNGTFGEVSEDGEAIKSFQNYRTEKISFEIDTSDGLEVFDDGTVQVDPRSVTEEEINAEKCGLVEYNECVDDEIIIVDDGRIKIVSNSKASHHEESEEAVATSSTEHETVSGLSDTAAVTPRDKVFVPVVPLVPTHFQKMTNIGSIKLPTPRHSGIPSVPCPICPALFMRSYNMRVHINRVHKESKTWECQYCSNMFATTGDLKQHLSSHGIGKIHKCKDCGREFISRDSAILHWKQHNNKRTHACTLCTKGFFKASCLQRHMRSHTGEKPYTCEFCKRGFSQVTSLKNHEKTCKSAGKPEEEQS